MDLAPTILALLGVEIPRDMDGRVLKDAFLDGAIQPVWGAQETHSASPSDDSFQLSEQEQAEIAARLRGLGYVS
jgi:arylsulfatase A-like enzyme